VKILQITRDFTNNGGIGRYVQEVTRALRDDGHTVEAICAAGPEGKAPGVHVIPGCDEFEHRDGSRIRAEVIARTEAFAPNLVLLHAMDDFTLELQLRDHYRVARFVHNHVHCPSGLDQDTSSSQPCARAAGTACITGYATRRCWHVRNPVVARRFYRRAGAAVANLRSAPLIFTASRYMRQRLACQGVNRELIVVAPYFARSGTPAGRHNAGDERRVLFVGRIVPEKGLHHLIEALPAMGEHVRLAVNGDGPARHVAEALARNLGVIDRVEFLGWTDRDRLLDCYRQADALIVPSLWPEPFGLVGLEAMSHGLPVVGYGSGAIPEWLTDDVTGFVVARGDIDGLAYRTRQILEFPALRTRMGRAAMERVRAQYTPARHIDTLLYSVRDTQW
jgi:glycosyltransferase involved in cell wall biosynthesis